MYEMAATANSTLQPYYDSIVNSWFCLIFLAKLLVQMQVIASGNK